MIRLSIFLCVVMLLYVAAVQTEAPENPGPGTATASMGVPSSVAAIGRPQRLVRHEPAVILPDSGVAEPAGFDLHDTTMSDPRVLSASERTPAYEDQRWQVTVLEMPVRAGPALNYPEVAFLKQGDRVIAQATGESDWLWIRTADMEIAGYAAAGDMAAEEPVGN
ncbi:MAG: SH3 domain-containing protein [Paracoccaceae bacterium]